MLFFMYYKNNLVTAFFHEKTFIISICFSLNYFARDIFSDVQKYDNTYLGSVFSKRGLVFLH